MSEQSLAELEREVEAARAKLAGDLSSLRSPASYSEFKKDLKHEATSTLSGFIEELKARAAANPSATLAIGAGLAWRVIERPPIAAALIGAGLISLWRTAPLRRMEGEEIDYLSEATERFKEQAGDLAGNVKEQAMEMAGALKEHASEYAGTAKDKVQQWSAKAGSELKERIASAANQASEALDEAEDLAAQVHGKAGEMVHGASSAVQSSLRDDESRDKILLGVAGLAVAAALGMAYQRRGA